MIRRANSGDVEELCALFDAYRRFYGRDGDLDGTRRYVRERLDGPTRFFVDDDGETLRGFVHVLPSYDTLSMRPAWILEDLFVDPAVRRTGVGEALLRFAEAFAREAGASKMSLSTAHANRAAQRLYERLGWVVDNDFRYYHRTLN